MSLKFEKQTEDIRGVTLLLTKGDQKIFVVETKKGFSRGGHYHNVDMKHLVVSGKIEHRKMDIKNGNETINIIDSPSAVITPHNTAHLLTALEDTITIETFTEHPQSVLFPKYREIVDKKMKS
jgi:dTDP-4-dehydrorhamnose 3,5-epimerase-like enzyme